MRLTPRFLVIATVLGCAIGAFLPTRLLAVAPVPPAVAHRVYVEFCIINDIDTDFAYFLGGNSQINHATTRTFNYPEGTEVFYCEKGEKAKLWFVVTADMNKQTYKLSGVMKAFVAGATNGAATAEPTEPIEWQPLSK